MTYNPIYTLVTPSKKTSGLTLYEACKALDASSERRADISHVRCGDRPVAFWCAWEGRIKSMFGAGPDEIEAMPEFGLPRQVRS